MDNFIGLLKKRDSWRTPIFQPKHTRPAHTHHGHREVERPSPERRRVYDDREYAVAHPAHKQPSQHRRPSVDREYAVVHPPLRQVTVLSDGILRLNDLPDQAVQIDISLEDTFTRFLREELDLTKHSLWDLVVLSGRQCENGDLTDVFACTVGQYVQQAWPSSKRVIKKFILDLRLDDDSLANQKHIIPTSHGDVTTHLDVSPNGTVKCNFDGPAGTVVCLVGAIQWLSAALQLVDRVEGPVSSIPALRSSKNLRPSYGITFNSHEPFAVSRDSSCWTALFPNTPCVLGFPTPTRPDEMKGVEIPFELMCLLSGIEYEVVEDDGLVLYGSHTMLYPLRQHRGCVQWHLEKLDKRGMPKRQRPFREFDFRDLEPLFDQRHFLGMWEDSEVVLGSESIDNDTLAALTWSRASEVSKETSRNGWSLGGSIGLPKSLSISATQNFAVANGRKNQYMVNFEANFHRNIQTPVLLYCPSEKRAWLVSYTSVALHLARVRAATQSESLGYFIPGCKERNDGGKAAFDLVKSCHETPIKQPEQGKELSDNDKKYTIGDYIGEVTSSMEVARRHSCRAHDMLQPIRNKLLGFELADIGHMKQKMKLKEYSLDPLASGCWAPLLEEIEYVFFCEGVPDSIVPSSFLDYEGTCRKNIWRSTPKGFNLLTASVPVLIDISKEYNGRKLTQLTAKHDWKAQLTFGDCQRPGSHYCSRLQEIAKKGKGRSPDLPMNCREGTVVFKYARDIYEIRDALRKQGTRHHQDRLELPTEDAGRGRRQQRGASGPAGRGRASDSGYESEDVRARNSSQYVRSPTNSGGVSGETIATQNISRNNSRRTSRSPGSSHRRKVRTKPAKPAKPTRQAKPSFLHRLFGDVESDWK